ncbi:MAG: WbuC family cupin fold metalloprotein [Candidatus Paceibacterota bacterium]|jgi:cupin fold WbuC family metalloprotein|nr:WbuC family cupin fold metalloprotein [Candidatus Paceibacterota bacterium]
MEVKRIDRQLITEALSLAGESKRRRHLILLHKQKKGERMTVMINAFLPGTYVRPHRHNDEYETEVFNLLKGRAFILIFDNSGSIDYERSMMADRDRRDLGISIEAGIWHSVIVLEPAVLLEVKSHRNGYDEKTDKEFAPWSPKEGTGEAEKYLKEMTKKLKSLI